MPINNFLLPGAKFTPPYKVANSCRFNDGDSAYMHKTPASDGNRRTWTISFWIKRGALSGYHKAFSFFDDANNNTQFSFEDSNIIRLFNMTSGSVDLDLRTNQLFRDPSAWYHIVVAVDSTQSTASNRVKIFCNGSQITSFSTETYFNQNTDTFANFDGAAMNIASKDGSNYFVDGYMAEVVMIDGSQLTPTSFGEFNEDSPTIWQPIDVSGLTFGTNGFYLDFEDSANLGNDANGGTDLTEVNLAATDQATDTPTNNFATGNPLAAQGGSAQSDSLLTFSEGNLLMAANSETGIANIGVSAGKWYWEVKVIADQDGLIIGACNEHFNINAELGYNSPSSPSDAKIFGYYGGNGNSMIVVGDGTSQSYGSAISVNDIIGVALDVDSADQTCTFYLNGSSQGSLDITNLGSGESYFPAVGNWSVADISTSWNFGSPAFAISSGNADANGYGNFEYSVPSGYYSLCTKNLAEFG